jgi:CheY-like chemotaxis protein
MEATDVASKPARLPDRRPRVLIVDDDSSIRLLCASHLRAQGYDVIEAVNGQDGLERAFAEMPDLVLLDISMPVLDGFGLAAALRGDERTQRIPFAFLSGETDPHIETRALEAGAHGYFAKPFDLSAVGEFVRGLLDQLSPDPAPHGGHAY